MSHVVHARRHCAGASDNELAGFNGESPAIPTMATRKYASYGCAIAMRTLWYHPHLRRWTRAAVQRTVMTTQQISCVAVHSSGARETRDY